MDKKRILITGGSGFLGTKISEKLLEKGYEIVCIDIVPPKINSVKFLEINLLEEIKETEELENIYGVINLAGMPIFGKWNKERKERIYSSRVLGTRNLINFFSKKENKPRKFISASAVGFYGDRGDELLNIKSGPNKEKSFLSGVANSWEREALRSKEFGIDVKIVRNGHILGSSGGMIAVLKPFYNLGIGGPIGNGKQYFPWVHVDDCVDLYISALEKKDFPNVINAVSGIPITNKEFSKTFAKVLGRPHVFRIPIFALKIMYGEFGEEMSSSQRIEQDLPIDIRFGNIENCLKDILI